MCFVMVRPFNSYQNPCFLNLSTQKNIPIQHSLPHHFGIRLPKSPKTKHQGTKKGIRNNFGAALNDRDLTSRPIRSSKKTPQLLRGRCEDGSILLLGKLLFFQWKPRNQPIQLGLILDLREEKNTQQ